MFINIFYVSLQNNINFFNMGLKKEVIQYNKEGEQIAIYPSTVEAAKAIGTKSYNVAKCCCGTVKSVKGFVFKYSGKATNQVPEPYTEGKYKCPFCDKRFKTYNGLTKHLYRYKAHGERPISEEELVTQIFYGGVRPTCKCGCGEYTSLRYDGGPHFCDYVIGRIDKVHNNWGHNPKAIAKSAETRRRQYANGERHCWLKGKKWKDALSPEEYKKFMSQYENKERNQKISKALKGRPKSPEAAEACRRNGRSEKCREACRNSIYRRLKNGEFHLSSQMEENFIAKCIAPLGVEYETQYHIKELSHYCDAYIPSKNTIIEFNGDYWHGNPNKYQDEELTDYQRKKHKKDEELRNYCQEHGIQLVEIWESEYKKNEDAIKEKIALLLG